MPPWDELRPRLLFALMLPANVAGIIFFLVPRLGPRFGVPLAGFLAIAAAFVAANDSHEVALFRADSSAPLTGATLWHETSKRVLDGAETLKAIYWLPWAAVYAGAIGVVLNWLKAPRIPAAIVQALVCTLAARLVLPNQLREAHDWLWPALAATMLLLWQVLHAVSEAHPGWVVPLSIGAAFVAASVVLLHSHNARLADTALIVAGGFTGIAFAAWLRPHDLRGAVPLAAVLLPATVFLGYYYTAGYHAVPLRSFVLVAVAPLLLAVALWNRASATMLRVGAGLMLVAQGVAITIAAMAEKLEF